MFHFFVSNSFKKEVKFRLLLLLFSIMYLFSSILDQTCYSAVGYIRPNFVFVANPEPILVCVAGCYHDVIRELPSLVETTCGILID